MNNNLNNSQSFWSSFFSKNTNSYPAELLVRLLKGNYKKFNINKNYHEQTVADLGSGSGNNIILLKELNFKKIYGIDITEQLVNNLQNKFQNDSNQIEFKVGTNHCIPLPDNSVDLLLSWGSSYYISEDLFSKSKELSYNKHLEEFKRVMKPHSLLFLDIPQANGDVYKNTYIYIYSDYIRDNNNNILKYFKNLSEVKKLLSQYFKIVGAISTKQIIFGNNYNRYTIICEKK